MGKLKFALGFKVVSTYVLLLLFFAGCSKNTAPYFSDASEPTMKMQHKTTILNAETLQLVDSMVESLSEVNFEYKLITTP